MWLIFSSDWMTILSKGTKNCITNYLKAAHCWNAAVKHQEGQGTQNKRVTSDFKKIIQDWVEWHKGYSDDGIIQSTRNG